MSLSEKNRLYKEFLAGNITAEEMHVLNQYALDDDFLFDAIEGASVYDSKVSRSMLELEKRLGAKKEKSKRPLWIWLSAAASIAALVIAIGLWNPMDEKVMADVVAEEEPAETVESDSDAVGKLEVVKTGDPATAKETNIARVEVKKEVLDEGELASTGIDASSTGLKLPSAPKVAPAAAPNRDEEVVEEVAMQEITAVQPTGQQDERTNLYIDQEAGVSLDEVVVTSETKAGPAKAEKRVPNLSVLSSPSEGEAKKRKKKSAGQALAPVAKQHESGVQGLFKVDIMDDPKNSLLLQQYLYNFQPLASVKGSLTLSLRIENGVRTGPIEVISSINGALDAKIRQYVESFEEWEGSGNKTVVIRFI